MRVVLPVFVGPTSKGTRVVLEGPFMRIARSATAKASWLSVAAFASKNLFDATA